MRKNGHYSAQRLSIEQITNLSNYCLQNASELIKEARLLFENKRYARSVFLSMVALEETSKRDITLQAILIGENKKQWGKFWGKFRSHRAKIAKMLQDYIVVDSCKVKNNPLGISGEYMSEIKATELQAKQVDLAKQWAMYVDLVDGEVFTPSQAFSRKSAFKALKLAEEHLQYHLKFKPTDEELEAVLSLKAKMKEGEDFIDYYKRTHSKNINKE